MAGHGRVTRRTAMGAGVAVAAWLGGCLGALSGGGRPESMTVELRIERVGGGLSASVQPAGEVEGVVRVNVGDQLTFDLVNDADVAVGVHNHVADTEVVVEAGDRRSTTFEVTSSMVGRHEIEGWVASAGTGSGEHRSGEASTVFLIVEVRPSGS